MSSLSLNLKLKLAPSDVQRAKSSKRRDSDAEKDVKLSLESKECKVVRWTPKWIDDVGNIRVQNMDRPYALLSSDERFLSSFLRIDILLIGLVDDYVIYLDVDTVIFSRSQIPNCIIMKCYYYYYYYYFICYFNVCWTVVMMNETLKIKIDSQIANYC